MNNQLALETQAREYQLARNRWFAYKNSEEFKMFPDGIAANIILSAMFREKRKLDELKTKLGVVDEQPAEEQKTVPVKRTAKRKATAKSA